MTLTEQHKKLDEQGRGYCAVPMWVDGLPAGFCNAEAYGMQIKGQTRYVEHINGRTFSGYCGGLACYNHGGPDARVFMDGDMYCAVRSDFRNLAVSLAGFGKTPGDAIKDLKMHEKGKIE